MDHTLASILLSIGLLIGILICFEVGRRNGIHRIKRDGENVLLGVGSIEGAIFALLGLLLAFTFYGAAERFDVRRDLIVEETNKIGTAYLRIDLLPSDVQPAMRENFRRYVDSRLEFYRQEPDSPAARQKSANATKLQQDIWHQSVTAADAQGAHADAAKLLLPALNDMIDMTTTRMMALQKHPPTIVFVMVFGLAFISALVAGCAMAASSRSWVHTLGFAFVMAFSVYVILDLEYPRLGLIRVNAFDRALVELREGMK
jgi:hypothetical protein